ncbi:biopolymer transport protein ExbD [Ectothiorhodospira mobilis]|uniref:Biopolymer transport protein ExbD n=1 Tax=Ectothiorhodospira mobilis TaxID=195064 RepID=A0A1I4Q5E1_ECTMO|nr:biopolymer transporter ExbD [Ectothiorhodospira mobilis]SFM35289.1 biopolymer transport protein ExbD [Ectothiorhodospira mobilis]
MNFRRKASEPVEIQLTPLIDVVFLLLIFFMVSTTFDRPSVMQLQLPRADSTQEAPAGERVRVGVDAQGRFFVDGAELVNTQPRTLRAALSRALEAHPDAPVVVQADARAPHQAVVRVMDAAARLGVSRLSIATLEEDPR